MYICIDISLDIYIYIYIHIYIYIYIYIYIQREKERVITKKKATFLKNILTHVFSNSFNLPFT